MTYHMPEEVTTTWKQQGHTYLWHYPNRYKRNMPGWHFSADADGVKSLQVLLDLLLAAPFPRHRRIETVSFTNDRYFNLHEAQFASSLTLLYSNDIESDFWQLTHIADNVSLTLGEARLRELKESIGGILHWKQDYALRPMDRSLTKVEEEKQFLWFWTTSTEKS